MSSSQWPNSGSASVRKFTQSAAPLLVSGSILIPYGGVKRIEALLCGGGGGGAANGGGFGGVGIFELPNMGAGATLNYVIGAGGAPNLGVSGRGGTTSVKGADGTVLALIGGGGSGLSQDLTTTKTGFGLSGGGGGGGSGGIGGRPPLGRLIWTPFEAESSPNLPYISTGFTSSIFPLGVYSRPFASGGWGAARAQQFIAEDGGGGAGFGGYTDSRYSNGGRGAGGGYAADSSSTGTSFKAGDGGSMVGVSVWGLTGKIGGTGASSVGAGGNAGGGGGGGLINPGGNGSTTGQGGNGGLGGGGGGGGNTNTTQGYGGNGFAMFRFYF